MQVSSALDSAKAKLSRLQCFIQTLQTTLDACYSTNQSQYSSRAQMSYLQSQASDIHRRLTNITSHHKLIAD